MDTTTTTSPAIGQPGASSPPPIISTEQPREESSKIPQQQHQHQLGSSNGNGLPPFRPPSVNRPASASLFEEHQEERDAAPSSSAATATAAAAATATATATAATAATATAAADDLLVPLASFDWAGFESQCKAELQGVDGEERALREEFQSWSWVGSLLRLLMRLLIWGSSTTFGHLAYRRARKSAKAESTYISAVEEQ